MEGSRETSKDRDGFNVEEGDMEAAGERQGVCVRVCVCELEGFSSSYPAVRPLCTFGDPRKSVSTEEGEEGSEKKRQQLLGGGYVRGEMKDPAAGYQANEWPQVLSLIEI